VLIVGGFKLSNNIYEFNAHLPRDCPNPTSVKIYHTGITLAIIVH